MAVNARMIVIVTMTIRFRVFFFVLVTFDRIVSLMPLMTLRLSPSDLSIKSVAAIAKSDAMKRTMQIAPFKMLMALNFIPPSYLMKEILRGGVQPTDCSRIQQHSMQLL